MIVVHWEAWDGVSGGRDVRIGPKCGTLLLPLQSICVRVATLDFAGCCGPTLVVLHQCFRGTASCGGGNSGMRRSQCWRCLCNLG